MKNAVLPIILAMTVSFLRAQDAGALSHFFEGKQVVVKIDLPGSQQGIDIYPQRPDSFDAKAYGRRMKSFPVSLRNGDTVVVTTVKVKDELIEFQLGGGGFGTLGDDSNTAVNFTPARKSQREKDLEEQLSHASNPDQKDSIKGKLDSLRRDRERNDRRNRALAERAAQIKRQRVDEERATGGSRFNLKYDAKVPANVTPQDVMAALAQYVSFPFAGDGHAASTVGASDANSAPDAVHGLQKGMREDQVRALLGNPTSVTDTEHDGLQVHTETFVQRNSSVRAEFVNGVLVRYSIDVR